jgi:N-acetylglucosamine kinase-like BadF-type ATPase
VSQAVLGVDAGGTKTVALVCDAEGRVLGAGRAGAANIYTDVSSALEAMDSAMHTALEAAGLAPNIISSVCLSATGADWPEDFALLQHALEARGYARAVVVNDAMGALRASTPDGVGVAVVCGTAAGIGARGHSGQTWHSSFWQEPEGAEMLARLALRAVYRAELGLDAPTLLTERMLEAHGVNSVEAVLHLHTRRERPTGLEVGRLARVLLDAADAGDPTALRIVREHGAALGDYALVAARHVSLTNIAFTVALSGGVMRHPSSVLRDALEARVREAAPLARVRVVTDLEPVAGAVMLALENAGVAVTDAVRSSLRATFPSGALFHT